jgi:hypothetical protein
VPKAAPQEESDGQPKVPVMPHEAPVKQAKPDETQA